MLSHVQLNVSNLDGSVRFYLSALAPLGFRKADEAEGKYVRLTNGVDVVIILCPVGNPYRHYLYHRKGVGLGHIAINVDSRQMVDLMAAHLGAIGVPLLGQGKAEFAYRRGYYTLAFEDLDRIMIEIVHTNPYYYSLFPP